MLRCSDNSYYCGITTNVDRRIQQHNKRKGAKYTSSRTPVTLIDSFSVDTKSEALQLESFIKKLHRAIKPKAIELFKKFIGS